MYQSEKSYDDGLFEEGTFFSRAVLQFGGAAAADYVKGLRFESLSGPRSCVGPALNGSPGLLRPGEQDQDGESHGNTSSTSLAHSTFFPDSIEDINSGAGGFVGERETTLPPKHARRIPSPSQKVAAGGMQNIRQQFREDGFSLEATKLLMDSWRPGTNRQYEHYIKKWAAYAERVGVDCMSPPVAQARNFLAELHTSKASFSALCSARAISRDTVSRWIRTLLDLSGIDLTLFTAHSTRAASTSAAARAGLPLASILNSAGWSSECTFARFYRKEIKTNFGQALLQAHMTGKQ
ncbi:reverse transcriptase/ribonuclease h/methyltransferase [Plakobranchus ocellatus]|uniref:Reverse transcriptase/ribonuclease h/methyltransferase n=1 Tax=Plakobranchus ocellatus TaxID=259542 RepID=A0AAV4D665_9GAST|nr:reverse transcriptase/ribonuclease h/methyltransferase [Plakobranchus ocellatus]